MERARDLYGRMRLPLGLMGLERRWLGDEGNSASPARNTRGLYAIGSGRTGPGSNLPT